MYQRILLATDGSDGAAVALEHAVVLAERFDGRVDALFVVDTRFPAADWNAVVEAEEAEGEAALDTAVAACEERGITVKRHLRRGVPHEEIVDAAADYDTDIIVMGTHGRTGLQRFIHAGSVAERVVRTAPLPVLTARERERPHR